MKTKKTIKIIVLDTAILALLYAAIIDGNYYATNLLMPVVWVLILLYALSAIVMPRDYFKDRLFDLVKNRGELRKYYSFTYDISISLFLIANEFLVSGVCWLLVKLTCHAILYNAKSELDKSA